MKVYEKLPLNLRSNHLGLEFIHFQGGYLSMKYDSLLMKEIIALSNLFYLKQEQLNLIQSYFPLPYCTVTSFLKRGFSRLCDIISKNLQKIKCIFNKIEIVTVFVERVSTTRRYHIVS